MPWSKFDPHRPQGPEDRDALRPATPAAGRRARALRWAVAVTTAMTVAGYLFIAYLVFGSR